MSDQRYNALALAIQSKGDDTPANVVKRAESFLTFLSAGVAAAALAAPTPTASPLAEPEGTEPARLDDPKVVAQTEKAVTERPTVSGDATSPQTDADPASATGSTSDASAASGSGAAPATEGAPSAAGNATPPVAEVNAAVLAYNRANGREKTLALLGKFGGSKVPEIDVSKHAELLAELKAGTN